MELTREKIILLIVSPIILGLGLFLFLFQPRIKELKIHFLNCSQTEEEVNNVRNLVTAYKSSSQKKVFASEQEISNSIDELARKGKAMGIDFLSITPRAKENSNPEYQTMQVEMEIESNYRALGAFLGSLDKLERSFLTARGFHVVPRHDGERKGRLRTRLTLVMYLANLG